MEQPSDVRRSASVQVGSWELFLDDQRLVCSDDACRLLGFTGSTLDVLFAHAYPDDATLLRDAWTRAMTGSSLDFECRMVRDDGHVRHVHMRAGFSAAETGRAARLWGTMQDVTDRPRISHALRESAVAEAERRESDERFRQLAENIDEVFWLTNLATDETIYISPAFETIFGRPLSDLVVRPELWQETIHPDDRPGVLHAVQQQAAGNFDEEYRIVRPDGAVRWIAARAFPIRDERGKVYRIAGIAQDITERHDAQEAIQSVATGLTTTLESITDAFYTLDRYWRFTYVNHEAERLLRSARADLLERSVWEVFPASVGTEFHRQFLRAVADGVAVKFEDYYPPLERWFEVRAFPSSQGLAVYFLDVTERRRAADALRTFALRLESAQDAERSTIARELHDDLGQSLTVLRMDATRLARLAASNPEASALVAEMTQVIDATLQRTRSIAIALHPTALEDLGLAGALEIHVGHVARRASLETTLELAQVSSRVDRARARAAYRVAQECLTNVVRHAGATHVSVRLAETENELTLEVADDGCGFDVDARSAGTSLGLLGMRERAAAFGGTVVITPRQPHGTTVTLRLPLETHA